MADAVGGASSQGGSSGVLPGSTLADSKQRYDKMMGVVNASRDSGGGDDGGGGGDAGAGGQMAQSALGPQQADS